ncbi:hypothetical protein F53441_4506 [Fusarium austroafricanum]|uniref:Uncharacterized protein n=1 Tax=Fusarium austroafricanum TaxID=2364996 RepID=A0A8H4NVG6_9HYPO|nr:hypothetical protein F53441_4506 [Fusarium austroafricanum]
MSSPTNSTASSPIKSRRTSSTASNLSQHELEYSALRDEHLSYEDDVDFHIFIDALDRVETLVTERTPDPRRGRKESISRVFSALKLRRNSTIGSTAGLE